MKNNCDLNDTSIMEMDNFIVPNLNCDYNVAVNVSLLNFMTVHPFIHLPLFTSSYNRLINNNQINFIFLSNIKQHEKIDIFAANIIINDELCCPSSAANTSKNNTCDIAVCYLLYGCHIGKHSFEYIQS